MVLLFFTVFLIPTQTETAWIESCYGEACLDRPEPIMRNYWGYQASYCDEMYSFTVLNETDGMTFYNMTKSYCSI